MVKHPGRHLLAAILCIFSVLVVAGCNSQEQNNTVKNAGPQEVVSSQGATDEKAATLPSNKAAQDNTTANSQEKTAVPSQPGAEAAGAKDVPPPSVDNSGNLLIIDGEGLNNPARLSLKDLQSMPEGLVEDSYFSLNNWGTKEYFTFKGISLWYLLKNAGIKDAAKQVVITAKDGYSVTYTVAEVKRDDYIDEQNPDKKYKMIIAWEENGKPYDPSKGYPFRLVAGQKAPGDINKPNWVQNVQSIRVD
jgi:DMSO/TMAO reductase YedYZ molybdopterin-dependent catalytic subunit